MLSAKASLDSLGRRDPDPRVRNHEFRLLPLGIAADVEGHSAALGELYCISYEVQQYLPQPQRVGSYISRKWQLIIDGKRELLFRQRALKSRFNESHQLENIASLQANLQLTGFDF